MTVLQLDKVCVRNKSCEVLKDVSLSLNGGEILAIVGPNGAGKTSLLRAITDVDADTSGQVELAGKNILHWPAKQLARHLAVLPQLSLLNFPYRVEEVVALGRIPHETGIAVDQEIIQQAMVAMDIWGLRSRLYTQLSGGEKQRTQLARVMTQIWRKQDAPYKEKDANWKDLDSNPRLLLLDEPTSALDLGHQQQLMAAVSKFAEEGAAVIMVVHDVNIAAKYAHRIVALSDGKLIAQGDAHEVLTEELLHTLYNAHVKVLIDPESQTKVIMS